MSILRLARTRRWLGFLALAVLVAVVCCGLGAWQLARRAEARAANALVAANWDRGARPVDEVLETLDAFEESQTWTPVELRGEYLVDDQLLVRNRPYRGQPGFEVLVPFRAESGAVFVVDRGWLPSGSAQDSPDEIPAPPEGEVTVTARLKPGEPTLPGRGAPEGQVATINLPQVAEVVDGEIYSSAYGLLASESPAPATRPTATARPEPDEGPHLSYALQWFVFATFGFVAWGYGLRQEFRMLNADDPEERERARLRTEKRARRAPTDADIEDALLDGDDEVILRR